MPCFVISARLSGCEEPGAPPGIDCLGHRSCLSSDPTTADRMPQATQITPTCNCLVALKYCSLKTVRLSPTNSYQQKYNLAEKWHGRIGKAWLQDTAVLHFLCIGREFWTIVQRAEKEHVRKAFLGVAVCRQTLLLYSQCTALDVACFCRKLEPEVALSAGRFACSVAGC